MPGRKKLAADQPATRPAAWLFKEEPDHYSFADLEKDGETMWSGVKNPVARRYLGQVQAGDRVLYYHTGQERAIVGEMRAVAASQPDPAGADPKAVSVKVQAVRRWPKPVTLAQIKADSRFADWELVRLPRLSVMPVSAEQLRWLESIAKLNG
jgi:predicted RNA-binding protein with PUA-like domain